jgi:hypothetical protein
MWVDNESIDDDPELWLMEELHPDSIDGGGSLHIGQVT